jgi:hypothetical protein
LLFFATTLASGGCGSVNITPGSGGGGSSGASVTGSASSAGSTSSVSGGSGGSSTTGASQSSSDASSSTGPEPGYCATNDDCVGDPSAPVCDPATHACVVCVVDLDCPLGTICAASACIPGCSATQACSAGETCCGAQCVDVTSDIDHCGTCVNQCPSLPSAASVCQGGLCGMGACDAGHANCNTLSQDGCEQNLFADGPCACVPGTTQPCYLGSPGTQGVGPCKAGAATCNFQGTGFGACTGQVLPIFEICGNTVDDDCDGVADNVADLDGDGWTLCDGDCCDLPGPGCPSPKNVNPGAVELLGNGVDDDCDPTTSDINPAPCPSVEVLAGVTGVEVAKAMDLCQITTAAPPLTQKRWGLIDAVQILPDGSAPTAADLANFQSYQTAILGSFGGVITPHKGPTMAALSTGRMRDTARPGYVDPAPGTSFGRVGAPPASFLAAHGGLLPSSAGCNGLCPSGAGASDGVNVRLTIRAPTNVSALGFDYRFYTAEYGARACSPYNDFFLSLLQSSAPGLPVDHNIAFDNLGHLLSVNNVWFEECVAQGCSVCPFGASSLTGTGFDVGGAGAATTWLTADAPIVPGETLKIDLMVFDVSDDAGDTAVLLDNFRWTVACGGPNCPHP